MSINGKPPGGICADQGQSYQSIERHAVHMRMVIAPELPIDQALPGLKLFERLGRHTVATPQGHIRLEYATENLPPGIEGCTKYDKLRNRIIVSLSDASYAALEDENRRARFCFAHEVGHAELHPCEMMRSGAIAHQMETLRRGASLTHQKFMDTEWQANAFGAALLMPAAGLAVLEKHHGVLIPLIVSSHFKVSMEAAVLRLQTFNNQRSKLLNP